MSQTDTIIPDILYRGQNWIMGHPKGGIVAFRPVNIPDMPGSLVSAAWKSSTGLAVMVSLDPTRHGLLRHASISHAARYPTWDEIHRVRDIFFPSDIDTMMVLPRASDYVNLHQNTFHVWQTPTEWGIQ